MCVCTPNIRTPYCDKCAIHNPTNPKRLTTKKDNLARVIQLLTTASATKDPLMVQQAADMLQRIVGHAHTLQGWDKQAEYLFCALSILIRPMSLGSYSIWVPFPPAALNPNRRAHSAVRRELKREYFDAAFEAAQTVTPKFAADGRIPMRLVFYPPNNKHDWDNLVASMKACIDGVAKAWGVNDRRFRPILIDFADPDSERPRVQISVKTGE